MPEETLRLLFSNGPFSSDLHEAESNRASIHRAAAILRAGGTVAFATETVYGLGANAFDAAAVAKIFAAKQRPAWDPLIVHIADQAMLLRVVTHVSEPARLWMQHFWPGPLTLLLPRAQAIGDNVTAGRARVGVRWPRHPAAQALLQAAKVPVAAPSANRFGHVSPTTAEHVLADLDGRIDAVLDAGPTEEGIESTVVDACEDPCVLYRPGAITLEQLRTVWPRVELWRGENTGPKPPASLPSPGVDIRHYAPRARVLLIEHTALQAEELLSCVSGHAEYGVLLPTGLLSHEQKQRLGGATVYDWGEPAQWAPRLYAGLRSLDAAGVASIVAPLPDEQGAGRAVCDRLRKAARRG